MKSTDKKSGIIRDKQPSSLRRVVRLVQPSAAGVCRTLGYVSFVLAGICIANGDSLGVLIAEVLIGHLLICAAEVLSPYVPNTKVSRCGENVAATANQFSEQ
jgi:hypothetical protein